MMQPLDKADYEADAHADAAMSILDGTPKDGAPERGTSAAQTKGGAAEHVLLTPEELPELRRHGQTTPSAR